MRRLRLHSNIFVDMIVIYSPTSLKCDDFEQQCCTARICRGKKHNSDNINRKTPVCLRSRLRRTTTSVHWL